MQERDEKGGVESSMHTIWKFKIKKENKKKFNFFNLNN